VHRDGNQEAQRVLQEVLEVCDTNWRGLGVIPQSGLQLRPEYAQWDAERKFVVQGVTTQESTLCIAGAVLQGKKKPLECPAFGRECTPERPLGAPMVSSEGACAAYYAFRRFQEVKQDAI
jgi:hydrogenase expression/formation protein HypD